MIEYGRRKGWKTSKEQKLAISRSNRKDLRIERIKHSQKMAKLREKMAIAQPKRRERERREKEKLIKLEKQKPRVYSGV